MRLIGTIVKPQGIKGELKIYPADTNMDIYKNLKHLSIDGNILLIKKLSFRQGFIYAFLEGIKDRNEAENYRNKKVYADDEELDIKEGTYFVDDLIGMNVVDDQNNFLGTISDVQSYGATDVITILDENMREFMLPHLKSIFLGITDNQMQVNKKLFEEMRVWSE